MATQKSTKSVKPAPAKAKPSKSAAPKKVAPKAPVKAKATVKPAPAAKAKKPAPAPKKAVSAKSKVAAKPKVVAKAKPVQKPKPVAPKAKAPAKPVAKAKPVIKKVVKPAPKPVAKKVEAKKPAPKPPVKAVVAPKAKVSAATPVSKPKVVVAQKAPKAAPVAATGSPSRKPVAPKAVPQVVAKAQPKEPIVAPVAKPVAQVPKKIEPKAVVSKPVVVSKPTTSVPSSGSKVTDKTGKPSVSTNTPAAKPVEHKKPEEKIHKPFAAPVVKQTEKMSEKKEIRPVGGTTITEEPQKSRYSDKELEEFDQLIDQKLIVAREQLEFYLKQLEDMAENPDNKIKGLDDGLSSLESERVSSMASRQQKLIQHLENAKIRIKNKVYGICRETGKLISKERLRAVPHATLSIEAKQAQN